MQLDDFRLTTIRETDSTGSILSDLNCLSKSEDDLDVDAVIRAQNQIKCIEYKSNDNCSTNKQRSTLDRVAEFNSPNRLTPAKVMVKSNTCTTILRTRVAPREEGVGPKSHADASAEHNFVSKIIIKPEMCTLCNKRYIFYVKKW